MRCNAYIYIYIVASFPGLPLLQSCFVGLSPVFINLNPNVHREMSIEKRVQEILSHKFTNLHQNHETWLISQAHSSTSDGDVTTLLHPPYKLQSLHSVVCNCPLVSSDTLDQAGLEYAPWICPKTSYQYMISLWYHP